MISEEEPAKLSIRISRATHSHGGDTYRITVGDEVSRLQVVEVSLTATQFAEAITGLMVSGAEGTLAASASRARLGLRMDHFSVDLGRGISEESAQRWADHAFLKLDADSMDVMRVNTGKRVTFRWYRDPDSQPIDRVVAASLLPPRPSR